jgi:hypothetical protein
MSWLTDSQRLIGRCAWVAAWVGQLHALSRFATAEGAEDLALPATAARAVPAANALSPLLGWGDADLVYLTYGKIWFPLFLAFTLCALVIYKQRHPRAVGNLGLAGSADRVRAGLRRRLCGLLDTVDRQLQRAVPGGLDSDGARTPIDHVGVDRSRHHPPPTGFGAPTASPPAGSGDSTGVVDLASRLPWQCGAPGDVRLRDPRASLEGIHAPLLTGFIAHVMSLQQVDARAARS